MIDVSSSFQATDHFIKILESEVHEGTLVVAIENLALWAAKFGQEIPPKFVDWFPKGMALKSSTPAVRSAYLVCFYSALGSAPTFDQVGPCSSSLVKQPQPF